MEIPISLIRKIWKGCPTDYNLTHAIPALQHTVSVTYLSYVYGRSLSIKLVCGIQWPPGYIRWKYMGILHFCVNVSYYQT